MSGQIGEAFGWAATTWRGHLLPHIVRDRRRDVIAEIGVHWQREGETTHQGWRRAYRRGCRIIRVRVTPAFGARP